MVKGFNMPVDQVLYEMSYTNAILYSATIPSYGSREERKKKSEKDNDVIKVGDRGSMGKVADFLRKHQ